MRKPYEVSMEISGPPLRSLSKISLATAEQGPAAIFTRVDTGADIKVAIFFG